MELNAVLERADGPELTYIPIVAELCYEPPSRGARERGVPLEPDSTGGWYVNQVWGAGGDPIEITDEEAERLVEEALLERWRKENDA